MKRTLTCLTITSILGLAASAPAASPVTGQWDFNSGDLSATVGTPLAYLGSPATTFTTMTINGQPAKVMGYPGCGAADGYIMTHGIAPNGGIGPDGVTPATNVNQYTLIMDIMIPSTSSGGWHTLLQADISNSADATFFIKTTAAYGIGNYGVYHGTLLPKDSWHRVALVMDLSTNAAASGTNWWKYIDGQFVGSQSVGNVDNSRFSLQPTALLFTDNDGDTDIGFVNSIQIRNGLLTPAEIQNLGEPTAAGIPITIPSGPVAVTVSPASASDVVGMASHPFSALASMGSGTYTYQWFNNGTAVPGQTNAALRLPNLQSTDAGNYTVVVDDGIRRATNSPAAVLTVSPAPATRVVGQWDFNQTNAATYGQPLVASDPLDQGYDATVNFGVSDIAGQSANVMLVYALTNGGYFLTHGIAPNGGGTNVNQYTLIMDVLYPFLGWSSLFQSNPLNTDDGEIFFRPGGGLGVSGQYNGALTANEWHRVVLAFDLTRSEVGKYIDGTNVVIGASGLHDVQSIGGVDSRWSLPPTIRLLGDDDTDIMPVYVSSVQIRSGRMTDAAVAALGAPTASKIPGLLVATRSGGNVVIHWTGTSLQTAPSVNGEWTTIQGAAQPYIITAPTGSAFFRIQ